MRTVHETCPPEGCDICQSDWPCARLAASKQEESCVSQLAATNERIRELEQSLAIQVDDSQKWYKRHAAEREVSDKLVTALDQMLDDIGRTNSMPSAVKARAALAEVAALRATREKAD